MKWNNPWQRNKWRWEWHRWFAWYPVVVDAKTVWLETVMRKAHASTEMGYLYEYRALNKLGTPR